MVKYKCLKKVNSTDLKCIVAYSIKKYRDHYSSDDEVLSLLIRHRSDILDLMDSFCWGDSKQGRPYWVDNWNALRLDYDRSERRP